MTDVCEILIRNNDIDTIASKLAATGKWEINKLAPEDSYGHDPIQKCDSDFVLKRLEIMNDNEFAYLALWSENSYHIGVDEAPP
ncbi:AAA family ATPase [Pyrenophora seminiperda CCB06]|uniref:AAA family ATPase n=1 Tax=Pyrenophora seminiperda CCB06 TaxID=1302712 RepID=A0A3M7MAE1_9PLEO|nr:AAA family ATPase [Pyrenophora seminiperda CCB06]